MPRGPKGEMRDDARHWRQEARLVRYRAQKVDDPKAKALLESIAVGYDELAMNAERLAKEKTEDQNSN